MLESSKPHLPASKFTQELSKWEQVAGCCCHGRNSLSTGFASNYSIEISEITWDVLLRNPQPANLLAMATPHIRAALSLPFFSFLIHLFLFDTRGKPYLSPPFYNFSASSFSFSSCSIFYRHPFSFLFFSFIFFFSAQGKVYLYLPFFSFLFCFILTQKKRSIFMPLSISFFIYFFLSIFDTMMHKVLHPCLLCFVIVAMCIGVGEYFNELPKLFTK